MNLRYEICRQKDQDLVVIKSGKINKKREVLFWTRAKPLPRAYFVNKVIKVEREVKTIFGKTKKISEFIVRWNAYWGEALDSTHTPIPEMSIELANLAFADDMTQMRDAASALQKFILDEQFLKLVLLVFGIGLPFGIMMNTILGLIPSQIIRWVP